MLSMQLLSPPPPALAERHTCASARGRGRGATTSAAACAVLTPITLLTLQATAVQALEADAPQIELHAELGPVQLQLLNSLWKRGEGSEQGAALAGSAASR